MFADYEAVFFGTPSYCDSYSPNNGWEEDHFRRRRAWDEKILQFMERKKAAGVNIMWVGDLVSFSHMRIIDNKNTIQIS